MSKSKTVTLDQVRKQRPTDEAAVAELRDEILEESRANRLADLRRGARLTQEQIADRIGVDQPRVSRIERGDLARTEVGSLAAYAEAMGGTLELVVHIGGKTYPLPVGRTPGAKAARRRRTSPDKTAPLKADAQTPAKKVAKPKATKATNSASAKKLAG